MWPRNFWLRLLHLVCIEIVVGQTFVALECPLTSVERDLRGSLLPDDPRNDELTAGQMGTKRLDYLEGASPIARFCHDKLFHPLPQRISDGIYPFVVAPFGLVMLLTWVFVPPRAPSHSSRSR